MNSKPRFTERESAVIGLLTRGMSNKGIAVSLGVSVRTVERVTATQIVLDTGSRFRIDTLRGVGDNDGSLSPLTDPSVIRALANRRLAALRYEIDRIVKDHDTDVMGVVAAIDEVAAAVAKARAYVVARAAALEAEEED